VAVPGKETRLTMIPSQDSPNGGIVELRYFTWDNSVDYSGLKPEDDVGQFYMRSKETSYQAFLKELRDAGAVHPVFDDIEDGIYEDGKSMIDAVSGFVVKTFLYGWFYVPNAPKEA
jgi:hypothetical protein